MGLLKGSVIFTLILFIAIVQGITDGINVTIDEVFPYHAHIGVYDVDNSSLRNCSGAVINTHLVITSYSCVSLGKWFRIKLGSFMPGAADDNPAYDHETNILPFVPPDNTEHQTIALLQVPIAIPFNSRIKPVTIHNHNAPPEFRANASGYNSDGPEYFQYLSMRDDIGCYYEFSFDKLRYYQECAVGHRIGDEYARGSLCKDKGVPLVIDHRLFGILEYNNGSCGNGSLNLFTGVRAYFKWIKQTMNKTANDIHDWYNATQNQFPYHAHIEVYRLNRSDILFFSTRNYCSGAVLSPLFIITSQDCVSNGHAFRIRLGTLNPAKADDHPAYEQTSTILILSHSDNTDRQGVALIKVPTEIPFNDRIRPVTLPEPINLHDRFWGLRDPKYHYAIATGYLHGSEHLQWFNMQVFEDVRNSNCHDQFPLDVLLKEPLCGLGDRINGIDGRSLCKERAILVRFDDKIQTLVGILGQTDMSCNDGLNLFIDVRRFVNWIEEVMNEKTIYININEPVKEYNISDALLIVDTGSGI